MTDAVAVKSAFMSVFKQERRIDVLVTNAGVVVQQEDRHDTSSGDRAYV